jgi:high-affinity K+ transport system ATPase subunit B
MWFDYIKYPVIGFIECFLITLDTKFVQRNKKLLVFIVSVINIEIWAYIVTSLPAMKGGVLHLYALVYGYSATLAITFDNFLEKIAKMKGKKLSSKLRKMINLWKR